MEAVSPAETLRSLTMPSNGARTTVRSTCWRAAHSARLGGRDFALGAVAAHFGVVQGLGRGHARGAQGLQALELAGRLLEGLAGGALGFVGRHQAVADRGLVELDQHVAALDRLAIFLEHLQHHGRDFGAQVGRRSGWIEPVITGPEASALLCTVSTSSGATSSWTGLVLLAVGLGGRGIRLGGFLGLLAAGGQGRRRWQGRVGFCAALDLPRWTRDAVFIKIRIEKASAQYPEAPVTSQSRIGPLWFWWDELRI
jgi:hypothetical protein